MDGRGETARPFSLKYFKRRDTEIVNVDTGNFTTLEFSWEYKTLKVISDCNGVTVINHDMFDTITDIEVLAELSFVLNLAYVHYFEEKQRGK